MSSSSSAIFNGNSRYSSDFQSVIDRSLAIASLPIAQLNNQKSALTAQSQALSGLDSKFAALGTAVQSVENALGQSSYHAAVSDGTVVSARIGAGVAAGTYSIEVQDIGAYASSMSTSAWTAAANPRTYQLVIGGTTVDITAASDEASAVAAKINEVAGDKVRATVVNVGGANADYRLILQSVSLGNLTPSLKLAGVDLQTQQTSGRTAKYVVAGSAIVVESSTRTVSIAAGLTLTLESSKLGSPVDVTVTRTSSALTSALSAFATAYNAAAVEVDNQRGVSGGALSGASIVSDLAGTLRTLSTWSDSGGSPQGLGLDLDREGKLTFDSAKFDTATGGDLATAARLLGSSTVSGFLKLATDTLAAVSAAETGEIKSAIAGVQAQTTITDASISTQQSRVDNLKERLQAQMSAADALIASMEQQYTYLYNLFAQMSVASQQYK